MNRIGHPLSPLQRLGRPRPAQRLPGVLDRRQHLHRGDQQPDSEEHHCMWKSGAPRACHIRRPQAAHQHRRERRHHVVSAKERHPERRTAQRRTRSRAIPPCCARKKQKDDRHPGGRHQNLRPVDVSDKTHQAIHHRPRYRRPLPRPQIAAQAVAGRCPQPVKQHPVPVQRRDGNVSVLERHGEQDPVQGIGNGRLHLPDQRVPCPLIGIPERNSPGMEFARLEIQPRTHDVRLVRSFQPGPFARDRQLPVEARRQQKQRKQRRGCAQAGCHASNPASPARALAKVLE